MFGGVIYNLYLCIVGGDNRNGFDIECIAEGGLQPAL